MNECEVCGSPKNGRWVEIEKPSGSTIFLWLCPKHAVRLTMRLYDPDLDLPETGYMT